jgi:hypothetical protein
MRTRKPQRRGYTGDLERDALMHWRRFCACLEALPADQAADLWRTVAAEIAALRRRWFLASLCCFHHSFALSLPDMALRRHHDAAGPGCHPVGGSASPFTVPGFAGHRVTGRKSTALPALVFIPPRRGGNHWQLICARHGKAVYMCRAIRGAFTNGMSSMLTCRVGDEKAEA